MDAPQGLRERKKQKTRRLIAETARRLFAERGFEAVPVAELARRAEVSQATVFNYFATKEDLVYEGMERFEAEMLRAVRDRNAGESVVQAFGRFVLEPRGALAAQDDETARSLTALSRTIAASPALRAREHEILKRYADALAGLIREELGADPADLRPAVVAQALIGLHAALIGLVRSEILGEAPDVRRIARKVRVRGQQALELLEEGLRDYDGKR